MIEISEELERYISESSSRYFEARLDVNGSPILADIRSMTINKGSCDGSSFQPASIYSSSLSATLDIQNGYKDIKNGDKVEVYFRCPLCSDNSWYKTGTMYASKPSKKDKRVNLTAEGSLSAKLGRKYTGTTPATINELIAQIKTATGVNIVLDGLDGSYAINGNAKLSNLLYREIVSYIAGCFFGYAHEDIDNNIIIRTFEKASGKSVTLKNSRMFEEVETFDTATVEGVRVTSSSGDDEAEFIYPANASVVNCSLNNPLMTQELFDTFVDNYTGFSYVPYNASMTLGSPFIEAIDTVVIEKIEARNGSATTVPMNIEIQFDGGIKTKLSAPTIDTGEELSRTEKEMQSSIAYDKIQSGDVGGGSTTPDIEGPEEVKYVDLSTSTANRYYNYLEVRNGCFVIAYLTNNYKKIPAKYKPAYPVTMYPATEISCASITLLPETYIDNHGVEYVAYVESPTSYISPKDPYNVDRQEYRSWGGYSADSKASAIGSRKECFWILADKLEELVKVGEDYNDSNNASG